MDELDALIDNAVSLENAELPESPEPEIVAQVEDTPEETVEVAGEEETSPLEMEAESDDDLVLDEDGEPDAPAEPDVTPDVTAMQASYRELMLRQEVEERDRQIRQYQAQQQMFQAQQQLAAMQAQWNEMEPDDAHRAELQFVSSQLMATIRQQGQQLQRIEVEKAQQLEEDRQLAAKPIAIQKAIEHYKLKPTDTDLLDLAQNADQLDTIAQRILARRREQTAKARQAKARKIAANPALTPTAQGTAAVAQLAEPKDIDEFIDRIFA